MSGRPLCMHDAAAAVGLSYERFRKVWPVMAVEHGFPRPFRGRVWDAWAIEAWKAGRSRTDDPEPPPGAPTAARARRQRAALEELRAA